VRNIPLSPRNGGRCIAPDALQPADIVVSTTRELTSELIRLGTHSSVSHAALYIGSGQLIEALLQGVVQQSIYASLGHSPLAVAYRRKGITRATANVVLSFARSQVGRGYDYTGLAGPAVRSQNEVCVLGVPGILVCVVAYAGGFKSPDRFYCSELVLEAFRRANLPIASIPPSGSSPEDIVRAYSAGVLEYVGHLEG
jgi:cell wall-associated NlpC family hydrolase